MGLVSSPVARNLDENGMSQRLAYTLSHISLPRRDMAETHLIHFQGSCDPPRSQHLPHHRHNSQHIVNRFADMHARLRRTAEQRPNDHLLSSLSVVRLVTGRFVAGKSHRQQLFMTQALPLASYVILWRHHAANDDKLSRRMPSHVDR
jgi:hypothetical protein